MCSIIFFKLERKDKTLVTHSKSQTLYRLRPLPHGNTTTTVYKNNMDGFEVRMYFIEILRKMNASVITVLTQVLALIEKGLL